MSGISTFLHKINPFKPVRYEKIIHERYPRLKKGLDEIVKTKRTQFIAELGTLHLSDINNLMDATRDMYNAGVDYVKVQCINPESAWWATPEQRSRYERLYWTPEKWSVYFSYCNKFKNPPFASVWDEEFIDAINPYVTMWKIGYKARLNPSLIYAVLDTGKPTLISTTNADQDRFIHHQLGLDKYTNSKLIYVIPEYPVSTSRALIPPIFNEYQGISIHTKDLTLISQILRLNPPYLELHVKGRHAEGSDTKFALNIEEVKQVVTLTNS